MGVNKRFDFTQPVTGSRDELLEQKAEIVGIIASMQAQLETGLKRSEEWKRKIKSAIKIHRCQLTRINLALGVDITEGLSSSEIFVDKAREMLDADTFYDILDATHSAILPKN